MKTDEIMEVAYPRKYVENIIIGLEDPLNEHLVKLIGFDFPAEQRAHFRREVRTWLAKIQSLRMKPDSRTVLRSVVRLSVRRGGGAEYADNHKSGQ
jgi:hypothetical protein